ncbi:MAG: ABC transporter permease [Alphaproteobacteria bacterium]|nr:ABC transporter permease [Alphaproteobacteria bacterium]
MIRLIVGRLLFMVPAALLIITFLFALFHLIPGDPAVMLAGDNAPRSVVDGIREAYGFDQPLHIQYGRYMAKVLQGDLGISNYTRDPVVNSVIPRIINTAQLAFLSMLFAMVVSLLLGCVSAMYWNRPLDKIVTIVSLLGICTPVFVTGLLAIYFFSIYLDWLPISGMSSWRHFILPVITLGAFQAAVLTRMVRSCMVDALGKDYITTARAKGAPELLVVFKHALRNALLPIVTLFGLGLGHTLGGSVVTETIFNWPGLGRLMVNSILTRDLPITQGSIFFFAMIFILVNLIVDLVYAWVDPRIRYD